MFSAAPSQQSSSQAFFPPVRSCWYICSAWVIVYITSLQRERKRSIDRQNAEQNEKFLAKIFFPHMYRMSLCPVSKQHLTSLWYTFFGPIAMIEFVLKNVCQHFFSFSFASCQKSYACMSHGTGFGYFGRSWAHSFSEQSYWWNLSISCQWTYVCHIAKYLQTTWKVEAHFFWDNHIDKICPENRCQKKNNVVVVLEAVDKRWGKNRSDWTSAYHSSSCSNAQRQTQRMVCTRRARRSKKSKKEIKILINGWTHRNFLLHWQTVLQFTA